MKTMKQENKGKNLIDSLKLNSFTSRKIDIDFINKSALKS